MAQNTNILLVVLIAASASILVRAFTSPNAFVSKRTGNELSRLSVGSSSIDELLFESILQEGSTATQSLQSSTATSRGTSSSSSIVVPDSSALPSVVFASSITLPPTAPAVDNDYAEQQQMEQEEEEFLSGVIAGSDAISSEEANDDGKQLTPLQQQQRQAKLQQPSPGTAPKYRTRKILGVFKYTDTGITLKSRLNDGDYNGIVVHYAVPLTLLGMGFGWTVKQAVRKYAVKVDAIYSSYANEMVYHDGDFEEMQMCHADYGRRLSLWTTPLNRRRSVTMIRKFLAVYAKKKPVSPQAISSLSYVLTMYKLSEESAAKILCEVAQDGMADKLASAGKLLFFGERILNSPGGKAALQPIRDMLATNYRQGGKAIVETSLIAMGEAAYRNAVSAGGKDQESLTVGWEVLGLSQETAERIFEECADLGFKSRREIQYGGARQKYDKKGRRIDADGALEDPTQKEDDDDDDKDDGGGGSAGNVYECTECGYTLFPAKGREFKFFPNSFKCPECSAPKSKFVGR